MSYGLPAIDTIKDLLSGSTTDKLKEFIEPFALVNAGIFLTLNLALVYPLLDPFQGNQFVASLFGLSGTWQAVLGGLTVLVLSYLINNLNGFFLDLMSGEVFRNTLSIHDVLLRFQRWRFDSLSAKLKVQSSSNNTASREEQQEQQEQLNQSAYRLAYDFPANRAELGLTGLGNLILSPSSYISHQYGASPDIVWPILHDSLGDESKLIKPVQDHWSSMQFFTSLGTLLLVVGLEILLVSIYGNQNLGRWERIKFLLKTEWVPLLSLLSGSLLCYSLAKQKARQWGGAIRRVFDTSLDSALEQLGMAPLKAMNPSDDKLKKAWRDVSSWLAYGAMRGDIKPIPDWYKAPSELSWPQVSHPEYLSVEDSIYYEPIAISRQDGKIYDCYERVVYRFAVSNTKADEQDFSGRGAYLIVKDPALNPAAGSVSGRISIGSDFGSGRSQLGSRTIEVDGVWEEGEPTSILFPLGNIAPGSSRILRFENKLQHLAQIELDQPTYIRDVHVIRNKNGYSFVLKPSPAFAGNLSLVIKVDLIHDPQGPRLRLAQAASSYRIFHGILNSGRSVSWKIDGQSGDGKDIKINAFKINK